MVMILILIIFNYFNNVKTNYVNKLYYNLMN